MNLIINIFNVFLLVFQLIIGFIIAQADKIPLHWNAEGKIDEYGNPYLIFILPLCAILMWMLCEFIKKNPQYCNIKYSEKNKEKVLKMLRKMLGLTSLWAFVMTSFLCFSVYIEYLYTLMMIIIVLSIIIIIGYYFIKLNRL